MYMLNNYTNVIIIVNSRVNVFYILIFQVFLERQEKIKEKFFFQNNHVKNRYIY